MADRDQQALKIRPWAEDGDRVEPEDRTSPAIDRDTGWPASFSGVGANAPTREVFNQVLREITGMLHEINRAGGILEWTDEAEHPGYVDGALVMGSDGIVYKAVQDGGEAADPTSDTNSTYWEPLLAGFVAQSVLLSTIDTLLGSNSWRTGGAQVTSASTTTEGIVEIANAAEHNALADLLRACVPGRLPMASATQRGLAERATQDEVDGGTDNVRFVTAATLEGRLADFFLSYEVITFPNLPRNVTVNLGTTYRFALFRISDLNNVNIYDEDGVEITEQGTGFGAGSTELVWAENVRSARYVGGTGGLTGLAFLHISAAFS